MVIKHLILDIDGVLTDGTEAPGAQGHGKRIHLRDLDALGRARKAGLSVSFLTGEAESVAHPVVDRCGGGLAAYGQKDKVAGLMDLAARLDTTLSAIAYVGDAERDAPALLRAGLSMAPKDAASVAKSAARVLLGRTGGHGAVEEAVDWILSMKRNSDLRADVETKIQAAAKRSLEAHERYAAESAPVLAAIAIAIANGFRRGGKLVLFGNGGSAADAQHIAAELVGRYLRERGPLPAIALTTDTSALTAIANDWAYEDVFARQVRALVRPGDVVAGITTSGKSPNVHAALKVARELGAVTVGFTGAKGTMMEPLCDHVFLAPSSATPHIQELHILAWHSICEVLDDLCDWV